jgi:glycosyltransferase involved in cell wall biosynthesis
MITGAYFPEVSGAGLQCRSLISTAGDENLSFCVITTSRDRTRPFLDLVEGIQVYRLPINGTITGIFLSWLYRISFLFFKVLPRVDIIHLHGFSRKSYFFILYALLTRKKVLLKMSSLGEDDPISAGRKIGLRSLFYGLADYYLSPSPALDKAYNSSTLEQGKLVSLPNGVDCERFSPVSDQDKRSLRTLLGLPENKVLVLFVGHFSADKQPNLLARAWSSLQTKDVGLVMVGSTDTKAFEVDPRVVAEVKEVAERSKVPGSMVLIERISRIEDYFRACDIFVLPSTREGLPNALLEAMAAALACVVSRLPGVTDHLLEPGAGILVETDDCEGYTRAIEKLAGDSALRKKLGEAARETILADGYEIKQVAAQYRNFYFSVTANSGSSKK